MLQHGRVLDGEWTGEDVRFLHVIPAEAGNQFFVVDYWCCSYRNDREDCWEARSP
jgi:hypothetical protein